MSIFTKGICLLFINCNSSYAFCWGDKRKQLKPTLLLESLSAPWPWSLSLGCPVKGLAYRRPLINVYLMTRKETEKIFKTQIRSIKKLKWKWGKRLRWKWDFRVLWGSCCSSAFSLLALIIENWLHLISDLLIDTQFIFPPKSVLFEYLSNWFIQLIFKLLTHFFSYKLVLYLQILQINHPSTATGEVAVKLNITKISIHGTRFSRDVGFMKWKWLLQSM